MGNWLEDPGPTWNEWDPSISESKLMWLSWSLVLMLERGQTGRWHVCVLSLRMLSWNHMQYALKSYTKKYLIFSFSFSYYLHRKKVVVVKSQSLWDLFLVLFTSHYSCLFPFVLRFKKKVKLSLKTIYMYILGAINFHFFFTATLCLS